MIADELIKAVNAEVVANKAVARIDGKRVVIARVTGDGMALTEEGEELAKLVQPAPAPKPKAKKASKSKPAAAPEAKK